MAPSWSPIHARVHRVLRQRYLLPPKCCALLAVSGGQDSLALAQLLLDLQPKWGWTLAIAHCDHRWRPDSAANAAHVRQLAEQWRLPCWVATVTEDEAISSEAAARHWRYQQLVHFARAYGFTYVVTGHTGSDRAETALYNLIRGSGADGLQALTWRRPLDESPETLWLVRPLLELFRPETAAVCTEAALPIWEDDTNQDYRYARNRIRHQLLPYLQSFNAGVERHLAQTAELLQADVACLDGLVDTLWEEAVHYRASTASLQLMDYRIGQASLQAAPLALQRRLLRRLLQVTHTKASFEAIESLVYLIDGPNRAQSAPLGQGIVGYVEAGWIGFKR